MCDRGSPVGNPLQNSKFKFRACLFTYFLSCLLEWMITFCLMKKSPPVRNKAIHIHSTVVFHCFVDDPQWRWLVRCSPLESRLTLTSAMRERGSVRCSHCNGHKDIEKIEAESSSSRPIISKIKIWYAKLIFERLWSHGYRYLDVETSVGWGDFTKQSFYINMYLIGESYVCLSDSLI